MYYSEPFLEVLCQSEPKRYSQKVLQSVVHAKRYCQIMQKGIHVKYYNDIHIKHMIKSYKTILATIYTVLSFYPWCGRFMSPEGMPNQ